MRVSSRSPLAEMATAAADRVVCGEDRIDHARRRASVRRRAGDVDRAAVARGGVAVDRDPSQGQRPRHGARGPDAEGAAAGPGDARAAAVAHGEIGDLEPGQHVEDAVDLARGRDAPFDRGVAPPGADDAEALRDVEVPGRVGVLGHQPGVGDGELVGAGGERDRLAGARRADRLAQRAARSGVAAVVLVSEDGRVDGGRRRCCQQRADQSGGSDRAFHAPSTPMPRDSSAPARISFRGGSRAAGRAVLPGRPAACRRRITGGSP